MSRALPVALALWLAVYIFLASQSARVFGVLVYSESKLMPNNVEPAIVDKIIGANQTSNNGTFFVLVYGPDLTTRLSRLDRLLNDEGFTVISPYSIQERAQQIYLSYINNTINNITINFFKNLNYIYSTIYNECIGLDELVRAYREAERNATLLLYATYGAVALNISTPRTEEFLSYYRNFSALYGPDEAVLLAADKAYGNVSWLLQNITWMNWATQNAVNLVARRLLSLKLNASLIELAENVSAVGVEKYLYFKLSSELPPPLRQYLPYVLCQNNTAEAAEIFRRELFRDITARHPPPTMYTIREARELLYGDRYALVIAEGTSAPRLNLTWAVPVSTDILMSQFTETVTSEVPEIDKTTSLAMLAVLLFVLGSVAAPLIILAEVGLTYLAVLGLIYLTSRLLPPYYLSVYIAAPVIFALGVDYNLLILGRYAEERNKGVSKDEAIKTTLRFARRAILTSGIVAGLALGSFGFSYLPFMQSIGLTLAASVALVLITAFTATPSILYTLGDRVFWPRGIENIRLHEGRSKLLARSVDLALRRPRTLVVLFLLISILLALFVATYMRITTNPISAMPETQSKRALLLLQTYFRNVTALSTTYLVFDKRPNNQTLIYIKNLPYFVNYTIYQKGKYYIMDLELSVTSTSDELLSAYNYLSRLRSDGLLYIGGDAGWKHVYYKYIYLYFWNIQIYIILATVTVALMLALRSVLTPLRLVATVLMSAVWGMALNVALFQLAIGQLTYWLQPVVLMSLLIAVGTDYDVFIISRIKEEVEKGKDDKSAIKAAIVSTGPIVTGAALILALAFLSIVQSQLTVLEQIGATVAFSAIFDAFIVRPLIVPAIMSLLSKYNWWPSKQ